MPSIRRILIATDFSPASKSALTVAMRLARATRAKIDILHVIDNLAFAIVELPQYSNLRDLKAEYEASAQARIDRLLSDEELTALHVRTAVVTSPAPAVAIVEYAETVDADLIVLGTHGWNALGRLVLGSIVARVIRTAPCPVLIARDAQAAITRILVPIDFDPASTAALHYARELAGSAGATLHLLHVVDHAPPRGPFAVLGEVQAWVEKTARQQLDELARQEEVGSKRPQVALVISHAPVDGIVSYAKDQGVDLIVMGTHGRAPVARMFLGSVAEGVVRTAACPVLTVRKEKSPDARELHVHQPEAVRLSRYP